MAIEVTTVTVHPSNAQELRRVRDEEDLGSMDEALRYVLDKAGR